jgi:ornithine carbamoyltransferase
MPSSRHFLDLDRFRGDELRWLLDRSAAFKRDWINGDTSHPDHRLLVGKMVALIFEWPATRTRLHFEVAARDLGGGVISFNAQDMQLSRGESLGDTARTLSRHAHIILLRTDRHEKLLEFARHSDVPVINGCTNYSHPFRVLVDLMTFEENRGPITGRKVTFLGNCAQNHATSLMHAATRLGFPLCLACPPGADPRPEVLAWAEANGGDVCVERDSIKAVKDCAFVCTDTWMPMGTPNAEERRRAFLPYQVNAALMAAAAPDVLFMHPLPAFRGNEVTDEVIDGPQSAVWEGGIENKRHLLKAIFKSFYL